MTAEKKAKWIYWALTAPFVVTMLMASLTEMPKKAPCFSACHYPNLFTYIYFLPPRSGLMNLAVGFNPRLRGQRFPPSRSDD
jgi:hypothetical protein